MTARFDGLAQLSLHPLPDGHTWRVVRGFVFVTRTGWKIEVPEGFVTDFASIPRFFWRILPPWDTYGPAALVHDFLYALQPCDRRTADQILNEAMKALAVPMWKRTVIYQAVRWCGGFAWRGHYKLPSLMLLLLLLTGCATVPQTEISWPTKAGTVSIRSPKQVQADEISVTVHTDGSVTTHLRGLKSENDATVLNAIALANLQAMQQSVNMIQELRGLAEKMNELKP